MPNTVILIAAVVLSSVIAAIIATFRHSRRTAHKLNLMVEAIGNGDFSLRFAHGRWGDDDVNNAMHRLADLMRIEKLRIVKSENYYSEVLKAVRTGIVAVGKEGFVKQVNAEALRIIGYEVLTHVSQFDRLTPDLSSKLVAMSDGDSIHVAFKRGGQDVDMLVRKSSAVLGDSPVSIFAFDDIRSALDAKELDSWIRLTRVLTHEIMNSMSPISSISQSLRDFNAEPVPEPVREGLAVIGDTASGLLRFVESFRRFSALPTPSPSPVSVADLVSDARSLALDGAVGEIQITEKISPADLLIYADPALIRQVLVNILKNARQAMTQSGTGHCIDIRAAEKNDVVTISIANDGPVIPADVAEQIFVPFFTTKTYGSGIGLSVSRQIMRLSHGNIDLVRSPDSRFATSFVLTFM